MRGQHQGRVALRKLKGTIDIGDIPKLGQCMACDAFKDNGKMACFAWHFPSLVSLFYPLELYFCVPCLIVERTVKQCPGFQNISCGMSKIYLFDKSN